MRKPWKKKRVCFFILPGNHIGTSWSIVRYLLRSSTQALRCYGSVERPPSLGSVCVWSILNQTNCRLGLSSGTVFEYILLGLQKASWNVWVKRSGPKSLQSPVDQTSTPSLLKPSCCRELPTDTISHYLCSTCDDDLISCAKRLLMIMPSRDPKQCGGKTLLFHAVSARL